MGWASGSELFGVIIDQAIKFVPRDQRREFYKPIYEAFRDRDWDTVDECLDDPEFIAAVMDVEPNYFDDSEYLNEAIRSAEKRVKNLEGERK